MSEPKMSDSLLERLYDLRSERIGWTMVCPRPLLPSKSPAPRDCPHCPCAHVVLESSSLTPICCWCRRTLP